MLASKLTAGLAAAVFVTTCYMEGIAALLRVLVGCLRHQHSAAQHSSRGTQRQHMEDNQRSQVSEAQPAPVLCGDKQV